MESEDNDPKEFSVEDIKQILQGSKNDIFEYGGLIDKWERADERRQKRFRQGCVTYVVIPSWAFLLIAGVIKDLLTGDATLVNGALSVAFLIIIAVIVAYHR